MTNPEQMNLPWLPDSAWIFRVRWGDWLDIPQYGKGGGYEGNE